MLCTWTVEGAVEEAMACADGDGDATASQATEGRGSCHPEATTNRPTHWAVHQNAPSVAKGAGTAAAVASDSRCSCGRLNTSCGGGGRALCAPSSHAGTKASNQQRSPGWLPPLSPPHCAGSTKPRARGVRKARPVRSAAVHAF